MSLKLLIITTLSLINYAFTDRLILKVYGGSNATALSYPYQVSIRFKAVPDFHHCGGAIISNNWILSASHCVYTVEDPLELFIIVGTVFLHSGGTRYDIKQFIVHDKFVMTSNPINDISALKTAKDIIYSDAVQPIPLQSNEIGAGIKGIATGWGKTSNLTLEAENLQEINLITITVAECKSRILSVKKAYIVEKNICTLQPEGFGTCNGDSGGPFTVDGVLTGIVSWGIPCALGKPDMFTSVAEFRSWIKLNTGV